MKFSYANSLPRLGILQSHGSWDTRPPIYETARWGQVQAGLARPYLDMKSVFTSERVVASIRERFNPTKGIPAEGLAAARDEFDRGDLRAAAMMWEAIEDRDDLVKAVAAKRKKMIAEWV